MAKLSKSTKSVIIAAAVMLVLGGAALALLMTQPDPEEESSSQDTSSVVSTSVDITTKESDNVLSLTVKNSIGEFSFDRQERIVSSTDAEGKVTSETEYYWTSKQMMGLTPNDTTIKAFMRNMAGLSTKNLVEENAEDLAKYGLETPQATVAVSFDDGTTASLCFGIQNPANTGLVYFREEGSSDVHQVTYYNVGSAFYDIKDFVSLMMTESYDANNAEELDYLIIERKDFEEPVEIRYMFDVAEASEDEDAIITTFNSHRFITPIATEVDSTKGQTLCYGLYGLSMASCEYLDKSEENLSATGLDDPYVTVTFKYGGKRRVLYLGDEIVTVTESDDPSKPALTTVTGYYAMMDGVEGIYSIAKDSAPWYDFTVQNVMSRRPVSPYIYTVDTITVTTPDKEYVFSIEGDSEEHSFSCNGQPCNDLGFRTLYQHLIASVGEELYFDEPTMGLAAKVEFKYREEYVEIYGTQADVLEYYNSDDRKSIIKVNGSTLFKVRQVYTDRLLSNIEALLTGGELETNW